MRFSRNVISCYCCHFLLLHLLDFVKEQPTSAVLSRLLRFGAVALIVGAVLMLCASMAAVYLWKVSDKNVSRLRITLQLLQCPFNNR